jgi:hypothetical protein
MMPRSVMGEERGFVGWDFAGCDLGFLGHGESGGVYASSCVLTSLSIGVYSIEKN